MPMNSADNSKKLPGKNWAMFIFVLCALIFLELGGYYYFQGTPRYSLYRIATAIKNHDSKTFLKYFDTDKVGEGFVDSTIKEAERKRSPGSSPEESGDKKQSNGSENFLKQLIPQLFKSLRPALEQKLIQVIEDPNRKNNIYPLSFSLRAQVEQDGDKALVTVKNKKGKDYHITMERTPDRYWKVVGIDLSVFDFMKKS